VLADVPMARRQADRCEEVAERLQGIEEAAGRAVVQTRRLRSFARGAQAGREIPQA
jgi:hypothetical protein